MPAASRSPDFGAIRGQPDRISTLVQGTSQNVMPPQIENTVWWFVGLLGMM